MTRLTTKYLVRLLIYVYRIRNNRLWNNLIYSSKGYYSLVEAQSGDEHLYIYYYLNSNFSTFKTLYSSLNYLNSFSLNYIKTLGDFAKKYTSWYIPEICRRVHSKNHCWFLKVQLLLPSPTTNESEKQNCLAQMLRIRKKSNAKHLWTPDKSFTCQSNYPDQPHTSLITLSVNQKQDRLTYVKLYIQVCFHS